MPRALVRWTRRRGLPAFVALAVAWASMGVQIVSVEADRDGSDASASAEWFPCKDHHCGCKTAEMCRTRCCCDKSAPEAAVKSCCGSRKTKPGDSHDESSAKRKGESGYEFGLVVQSPGCSGNPSHLTAKNVYWIVPPGVGLVLRNEPASEERVGEFGRPTSIPLPVHPPPPRHC